MMKFKAEDIAQWERVCLIYIRPWVGSPLTMMMKNRGPRKA